LAHADKLSEDHFTFLLCFKDRNKEGNRHYLFHGRHSRVVFLGIASCGRSWDVRGIVAVCVIGVFILVIGGSIILFIYV